jgi:formate dehydrogenase iron-sulfur subunit
MHCLDPTCASVCPVGALHKTAAGPVVYNAEICLGCRYCVQACPFGIPRYEWTALAPRVRKCNFCANRLAHGQINACAEACPYGATIAGDRDALLKEARARLAAEPGKYLPKIYGEHDAGGTSVLILSSIPFGAMGLPENLPAEPMPMLTFRVLSKIPPLVAVGASLLTGLWWLTKRKRAVALAEAREAKARAEAWREAEPQAVEQDKTSGKEWADALAGALNGSHAEELIRARSETPAEPPTELPDLAQREAQ